MYDKIHHKFKKKKKKLSNKKKKKKITEPPLRMVGWHPGYHTAPFVGCFPFLSTLKRLKPREPKSSSSHPLPGPTGWQTISSTVSPAKRTHVLISKGRHDWSKTQKSLHPPQTLSFCMATGQLWPMRLEWNSLRGISGKTLMRSVTPSVTSCHCSLFPALNVNLRAAATLQQKATCMKTEVTDRTKSDCITEGLNRPQQLPTSGLLTT